MASDKFRKRWTDQFPYDDVPSDLDFLKNPKDMRTLENCLDRCVQRTDELNSELAKQKFMSEFILQLMDTACPDGSSVDRLSSRPSATADVRSPGGDKSAGASGSSEQLNSNVRNFRDSSGFEMLDYDDDERTYSFESPIQKKSGASRGGRLLDRFKNAGVSRTSSDPNIADSQADKQTKSPKPGPRKNRGAVAALASYTTAQGSVLVELPAGSSSGETNAPGKRPNGDYAKKSKGGDETGNGGRLISSVGSFDTDDLTNENSNSPRSAAAGGRMRLAKSDVYEEAIPFAKPRPSERGERVLSDEEHEDEDNPIYYNILLLSQRTLDRAKMVYFNDEPSSKLDRQARKLSLRYSQAERKLAADNKNEGSGDAHVDHAALRLKRQSMINALGDVDELDGLVTPLCAEDEKLQTRRALVVSILDSEQDYVDVLDSLLRYMQTFKNLADTAQCVLSHADIDTIFLKIPELHKIHYIFIHNLRPKVEQWSNEQEVAEVFHKLAEEEYKIAPVYLKNYQKAVSAVKRCYQENQQFRGLTKDIQIKGTEKAGSLEDLIYKPVVRIQRNTLVLQDLINCTPPGHADYDLLQKTHKEAQKFLNDLENPSKNDTIDYQRYLVKHDVVVEQTGASRKLRHIFLFNDIFVCARQKLAARQRLSFEAEWFIPLTDLSFSNTGAECDESKKSVTEPIRKKVVGLQNDLRVEMKRAKTSNELERQWSFRNHTKNIEKIKKKLLEQKGLLILESPNLPFTVTNNKYKRTYYILLSSDYERTSWNSAVQGLLKREVQPAVNLSTQDLNNMLNSIQLPRISTMGSLLGQDDFYLEEEYLFGSLTITIRNLDGLKQPLDTYCCIEVDSFGHFLMQAKTKVIQNSAEPNWDEDFDIDLEGAQTLRVLCYSVENGQSRLIGKNAYELSNSYLTRDGLEEKILINEMPLSVVIMYRSREQTLRRTLSSAREGLFGVRIRAVTRREGSRIPLIVTSCVEDIESRGMRDVGIYRVSGLLSEVQRLKKAFEKNTRNAVNFLKSADINVITGLLKLYLRELPEALFTDAMYPELFKGMSFSDPEAREKYMLNVIRRLPEPNYSTVLYIMDHLIKVSTFKDENKMTLQNLATVFGPTLLRPAVKDGERKVSADMIIAGAQEALTQVAILQHLLHLRAKSALGNHA